MNEQLLKEILSEVKKTNAEVSELKSEVSHLKTKVESMQTEIMTMNKRLDKLEVEQQQIKQAVLETNKTVKQLDDTQNRHKEIIELLSARSIEHEAILKRVSLLPNLLANNDTTSSNVLEKNK